MPSVRDPKPFADRFDLVLLSFFTFTVTASDAKTSLFSPTVSDSETFDVRSPRVDLTTTEVDLDRLQKNVAFHQIFHFDSVKRFGVLSSRRTCRARCSPFFMTASTDIDLVPRG